MIDEQNMKLSGFKGQVRDKNGTTIGVLHKNGNFLMLKYIFYKIIMGYLLRRIKEKKKRKTFGQCTCK